MLIISLAMMMYSGLVITVVAYASCITVIISGGVPIEIHYSIVPYETPSWVERPRPAVNISSILIERFGVINCSSTFLISRQSLKPARRA